MMLEIGQTPPRQITTAILYQSQPAKCYTEEPEIFCTDAAIKHNWEPLHLKNVKIQP